ncbi:hypothetical protein V6N12_016174 [Hibiscus sabdariffa]|uniref:EF-hand domain-containing protein n=1 Tax=Hibiscus sabdariffa TaxID=183260 RepID=A0ABR2C8X2_9ROSI
MVKYYPGFDRIIRNFIEYDNSDAFVQWTPYKARLVGGYDVYQSLMLSSIMLEITLAVAVKCATALLQGETGLKLDIHAANNTGRTPLHLSLPTPELIDLFLCYGARVDIRFKGQLPLNMVIQNLSEQPQINGWSTRQSLYMTIVFCQCETRFLESIRLLFRATDGVEKEIYRYVKDGKLIAIAALLTVAREQVTSPSLFKGICDTGLNGSMSLRQLVSKQELATKMACLFISEGFAEYKDFEMKRSVSCAWTTEFHENFLELLESKLSGENEGTRLESGTTKIYKHVVDAMKESLENIRLVACKTEIETIGCDLARQGKLIELASLLMVAPEKLNVTTSRENDDLRSNAIHRCIMSDLHELLDVEVRLMGRSNSQKFVQKCKDEKEIKLSALLLLEVFERAGNSINQYLQSDTYNDGTISGLEIIKEIQNLLEKAGFAMKLMGTDLNDMNWYGFQHSGHAVHASYRTCLSSTMEPVDCTSLPLALRPHEFSVVEKKHGFSTQSRTPSVQGSAIGLRQFHRMVQVQQGNWRPKSKALMKSGIPNSMGWFLSLGVDIRKNRRVTGFSPTPVADEALSSQPSFSRVASSLRSIRFTGHLPLNTVILNISFHSYLNDWTQKSPIFKLVCILCLPQLGKLIELALLLMVAPEESIVAIFNQTQLPYQDSTRSRLKIIRESQNLLEKASFAIKPKDTDLKDIKWYDSQHSGHAVHASVQTGDEVML